MPSSSAFSLLLAVYLAVGHMQGTFLPFLLFTEQDFTEFPLSLSLLGQYILKNAVIAGALVVLYAKSARRQGKVIMMAVSREPGDAAREQEEDAPVLHQKTNKESS